MENMNFKILGGNYGTYYKQWTLDAPNGAPHYNLYYIADGYGEIIVDDKICKLEKGKVYYINGYKIRKYICDESIEIYWVHFTPESLFINLYLTHLPPIYSWDINSSTIPNFDYTIIKKAFIFEESKPKGILEDEMYINSFLLTLISDFIQKEKKDAKNLSFENYKKLKPSIDFMDINYRENLSLDEISAKSFLSSIYFLRLFKNTFNITPHQYLISKKMREACTLLSRTDLSIESIAMELKFCNQFYFSRLFKKTFKITPSQYRKTKFLP